MESIKLKDILPKGKKLKRVVNGSELLFLYELDKYTKQLLGKKLSLEGVTILKSLQKERLFSFVTYQGLDVGFDVDMSALKPYGDIAKSLFTDTVEGIVFKEDTDELVHYDFSVAPRENRKLNGDNRESAYISLVAYVIVRAYEEGKQLPKIVIGTDNYVIVNLEYHHLYILSNYGNKVLDGIVEYRGSNDKIQVDWESYVMLQRQKGFMSRPYTPQDKMKYIKKRDFKSGDVVLLYNRTKCTKGNTIAKLESCYPAVIDDIKNNEVHLRYYATVETALTRYMKLTEAEEDLDNSENSLLIGDDFDRFVPCRDVYDLTSLGIEGYTYDETTFILSPIDQDGSYQWLSNSKGQDYVWLSTLDTIYAVFEDRGVEYNREEFLDKYFRSKGRVPVYDVYKNS